MIFSINIKEVYFWMVGRLTNYMGLLINISRISSTPWIPTISKHFSIRIIKMIIVFNKRMR